MTNYNPPKESGGDTSLRKQLTNEAGDELYKIDELINDMRKHLEADIDTWYDQTTTIPELHKLFTAYANPLPKLLESSYKLRIAELESQLKAVRDFAEVVGAFIREGTA